VIRAQNQPVQYCPYHPLMLPTLVMVLARSMHWKGPLVLLVLVLVLVLLVLVLVLVLVLLVLVPRPPQAHPPMPTQAQSSPTPNPLKSCRPTSPASQQSGPQYSQVSPSRPYPTPP
jgi:cytoskeletal protein RodZ